MKTFKSFIAEDSAKVTEVSTPKVSQNSQPVKNTQAPKASPAQQTKKPQGQQKSHSQKSGNAKKKK